MVRRLAAADVVLTSFDVLQADVHYAPTSRRLRHAKRYTVPTGPLEQLAWLRVAADEAQMARPQGAVGAMLGRISAVHRWCVTGTPISSHDELGDLCALLQILQHRPFGDPAAWERLVSRPLAAVHAQGYDPAASPGAEQDARRAWRLLRRTLRPLMWRSTKEAVRGEYRLKPRTLHSVMLTFQPGEQEFYKQVAEHCKGVRNQLRGLREEVQAEEAAQQQQEEEAAAGGGGDARPSSLPPARTTAAAMRSRTLGARQ